MNYEALGAEHMAIELTTYQDAVRYSAVRAIVAAILSVVVSGGIVLVIIGPDPTAKITASFVLWFSLIMSFSMSTLLTGALSYRSALIMRELNLARGELQRISQTDQLTGLHNRRGFDDFATAILTDASEAGKPVAALMCDIDHFKAINDRFGHEFGDKVLIKIAQVFRSFGEQNGALVARHGGEEFAVLMFGNSIKHAAYYADNLRRACAQINISSDGSPVRVTISIGLTVSDSPDELASIMRVADQALYTAKRRGRDRVARFDAPALAA